MSQWISIQLSVISIALNPKRPLHLLQTWWATQTNAFTKAQQTIQISSSDATVSFCCVRLVFFFCRRPFFVCALEKFNKKSNGKYIVQHLIHTKIKCFSHLCCYLRNICHWQKLHIFYTLYERMVFTYLLSTFGSQRIQYGLLLSEFSPKWNDIHQS